MARAIPLTAKRTRRSSWPAASARASASLRDLGRSAFQFSPDRPLSKGTKMSEQSELSMSVQSAWDDLVVENPNRHKLEACLVSTIMVVVVCIMGLLLFVVIELQPANNLRRVSRRFNVEDCSNGTCTEFGHRVLGWINFQVKPCVDFHQWVCHGRISDSPEDTFMQTAQRSGTFISNAAFYNLFMRNYQYELTRNIVYGKAVTYIANLYDVCMNGLEKDAKGKHPLVPFLEVALWNGTITGFAGAAQASAFHDYHVALMKRFNYHPFGRMLKFNGNYVVMPMNLLGTQEQLSLGGFEDEWAAAYGSFATTYSKGSADDAKEVARVEAALAKAMQSTAVDVDIPSTRPITGFKAEGGQNLKLNDIVKDVFGDSDPGRMSGRHPNTGPALTVYDKGGAKSMNLATFKLLLTLSLFADEEEPRLADFFKFANKYQWGSKVLPVKVYRCGTYIENYLKPAMMHFIAEHDKARLENIKSEAQTALKALNTPDPGKKGATPLMGLLNNAKSKLGELGNDLEAVQYFYFNDSKAYSDSYFMCGGDLADWDPQAAGGFLAHVVILSEKLNCNYKNESFQKQYGFPVLGSEPFFDFVSETIYIPYGFTFPPNYHHFVKGIPFYHYAPAFFFRLIGETFKAAIIRNVTLGTIKGQWKSESLDIDNGLKCFQKQIASKANKTGALQLLADSLSLPLAYFVFRTILNHAAWDVKKQARLTLIPMFTEGQYFFIQAAQTRCEYWDTNPKIQFPKQLSGATHSDKVNLVFSKSNTLFADRFGCAKARPMATNAPVCKLPVQILKKTTEKEYPGVFV